MAYGLAEGLRKSRFNLGSKKRKKAIVIATFGNHFSLNEAIAEFAKEGLKSEVEKGHIVTIHLNKNTTEEAEKVRKIIRDHYGYVEPL